MSLKRLAVAVAVVFVLPVGSASAEVRSGSVTDPVDAYLHQNVDGTSYRDQDIQRVTASYDTAGSITMTFYFLDPLPAFLSRTDSTGPGLSASFNDCNLSGEATATVIALPWSDIHSGSVSVRGYEGSIAATGTLSADHRAITIQASAPVLANRAYSCVNGIELSHMQGVYCIYNVCSDYRHMTDDATDSFGIDAATAPFPAPEPERTTPPATATPGPEATDTETPTAIPSRRCVAARNALRTKQKQLKTLKAQRRSTHKRERQTALAKQIKTTRRGIAKARAVVGHRC